MAVACREGDIDRVKLLIKQGENKEWNNSGVAYSYRDEYGYTHQPMHTCSIYDWGLHEACKTNHMELIELMIEKVEKVEIKCMSWSLALEGACVGGYQNIIDLILNKLKKYQISINWDSVLLGSCKGGHSHLVKWAMTNTVDYTYGVRGACEGGNINILKLMSDKFMYTSRIFYDDTALTRAICNNQPQIVEFFISNGQVQNINYTLWFVYVKRSCRRGYINMVKVIINYLLNTDRLSPIFTNNYKILLYAFEGGYMEIVQYVLDYVVKVNNPHINWNEMLKAACAGGNIELVNMVINNGANDFNAGLEGAFNSCNVDLVKFMIECGAVRVDTLNKCLNNIVNHVLDYTDVIKLVVKQGATDLRILSFSKDFWTYNIWCINDNIDIKNDKQYLKLLQRSPFYIILVGNIVSRTRYGRNNNSGCILKKIPDELIRMLYTFV